MRKMFFSFVLTVSAFCSVLLTVFKKKYVATLVHIHCNKKIEGFFNKSITGKGWECSQNGEVVVSIPFDSSIIPGFELVAGFWLLVFFFILVFTGAKAWYQSV